MAARLRAAGVAVVSTREPGGTTGAEAIRALLLGGRVDRWAASTELLLMLAARDDHARRLIRPALDGGSWVLCDRFVDSTRVYQGLAAGLGVELVDRLHELLLPDLVPDLTLVLDLDPQLGLARRSRVGAQTRFDRKGLDFHDRVRRGFLELAAREPARFAVLDAALGVEEVATAAWQVVAARLLVGAG